MVSLCAATPDRNLTVLSHYNTAGAVVAQTNQHRKSDNDHIVCFLYGRRGAGLQLRPPTIVRARHDSTLSNPAWTSPISRFAASRNSCTSSSQLITLSATTRLFGCRWPACDCPASVVDAPPLPALASGTFGGAAGAMTASGFEGGDAPVCASSGLGFAGVTLAIGPDGSATVSVRSGEVGTLAGGAVGVRDGGADTASLSLSDASGIGTPTAPSDVCAGASATGDRSDDGSRGGSGWAWLVPLERLKGSLRVPRAVTPSSAGVRWITGPAGGALRRAGGAESWDAAATLSGGACRRSKLIRPRASRADSVTHVTSATQMTADDITAT